MATKTQKSVAFYSYAPNQQVVIRAGVPEARDPNGAVVRQEVTAIYADFKDNRLETDDQTIIKGLRDHDDFNSLRGWWEEGAAPDEPKPTKTQQHKDIVKAATKGDIVALRDLITAERETHNRPEIIQTAEEAISNIQVPQAEEHGAIGRVNEPAENEDAVPKIDPPDTTQGRVEPEVDRERVIKSEDLARARGEAVAAQTHEEPPEEPKGPVEEKLEAEVDVVAGDDQPEGEKLPEALAKAGKAEAPKGTRPKKKAPKKAKAEAKAIRESSTEVASPAEPVAGQRTSASEGASESTASGKSDGADSGPAPR